MGTVWKRSTLWHETVFKIHYLELEIEDQHCDGLYIVQREHS